MHKRSIRFSILLIILTLFVGFGVSFVAPKPVRADALGDFVARLTLGDFIRGLFEGLFGGGTRGADGPYPTATPTTSPGSSCSYSCGGCQAGYACSPVGCTSGQQKCNSTGPTPTPTIVCGKSQNRGIAGFVDGLLGRSGEDDTCIACNDSTCPAPSFCVTAYSCVSPTPIPCDFISLGECTQNCTSGSCTNNSCPSGRYKCIPYNTPTPTPIQQCNGQNCAPPSSCGFGGGTTLRCLTPTPIPTVAQCQNWDLSHCQEACPSGKCEQCQDGWLTHRCLPEPTATPILGITPGPNGCNLSCPVCPQGKVCDNQGCRSNLVKCNNPISTVTPTSTLTPTPTLGACPYTGITGWAECQLACGFGNCTNSGCLSGYRCDAPPPATCPYSDLDTCEGVCGDNNCTTEGCTAGRYKCTTNPCPYSNLDTCEGVCGDNNCTTNGCPDDRYKCNGPTVTPTTQPNNCGQSCANGVVRYCTACSNLNCSQWNTYNCPAGSCQNATQCSGDPTLTPTPTITVRPTATSVPLPPTVTVGPGTPSPTPRPTNTPVPYPTEPPGPPQATATPTTQVGAPCYYNVKLVNVDTGAALPSALQTGVTESGGCRTQGVRELVPSFFTQPSSATNNPEWPCTDATYVGEQCTQGIVTGQFICMGGPQHEIKGCNNRTSDAYQRVSIVQVTQSGATATPTIAPGATHTPAPIHSSFQNWFSEFITYVNTPGTPYSLSLSVLEDWRDNTPGPTPTPPAP